MEYIFQNFESQGEMISSVVTVTKSVTQQDVLEALSGAGGLLVRDLHREGQSLPEGEGKLTFVSSESENTRITAFSLLGKVCWNVRNPGQRITSTLS